MKTNKGFTLLEVVIVMTIVGILALFAIPSMVSKYAKTHVLEGLSMIENIQKAIEVDFEANGNPPLNRAEAGLSANATDTAGKFVSSINVDNGVIVITYGNGALSVLNGKVLTITPYESVDLTVSWFCGLSSAYPGLVLMGTSVFEPSGTIQTTTIPEEYLPVDCL